MQAASINEIKKELSSLESKQLMELCMNLAKYKKDNKELLGYLLFESHDKEAFVEKVKSEIDTQFEELSHTNLYLTKKSLRKIVKGVNKYIKYIGNKQAEVELLVYFCKQIKNAGIPIHKYPILVNLYNQQLKKINNAIATLHEDLQFDYAKELEEINSILA